MKLHASLVTDCWEEWLISIHTTKAGAWKAGNSWLNKQHRDGHASRALIGKSDSDFKTEYQSFRVEPIELTED